MTESIPNSAQTWITTCEGCKGAGWAERGESQTDGARLADAIERRADPAGIRTRRVSCTMGCERACNVIVQAEGKIGYSLGKFDGTEADAEAIVAYARLHAASATGQVPFRDWPQGVKGHFVSRQVPLPVEGDAER
ncbi:DUF1636 family protein [Celeribacter persicus]|uniref:Putative metal-binding protein n=1 Tax=Celeribacter persicus TaxID=1651082 RepID=A0A2T5HT75_9RHOB|nr:DUF1636 domain-containing protein [Celeribacter persicus]PTQ74795.1 putative metal-binding protein [Celeribacter persicus]